MTGVHQASSMAAVAAPWAAASPIAAPSPGSGDAVQAASVGSGRCSSRRLWLPSNPPAASSTPARARTVTSSSASSIRRWTTTPPMPSPSATSSVTRASRQNFTPVPEARCSRAAASASPSRATRPARLNGFHERPAESAERSASVHLPRARRSKGWLRSTRPAGFAPGAWRWVSAAPASTASGSLDEASQRARVGAVSTKAARRSAEEAAVVGPRIESRYSAASTAESPTPDLGIRWLPGSQIRPSLSAVAPPS